MDKVKILHIIESLGSGGAECMLVKNLQFLDKEKFDNAVIYLYRNDFFLEDISKMNLTVLCLDLKKDYNPFLIIDRISCFIKRNKMDIVHTHLFIANIYGRIAAKLAGCPTIITTLHNPDYRVMSQFKNKISYEIRRFIDRFTGKFCNTFFIAVSEAVRKSEEEKLGFKNIKTVYNSVDADCFRPLTYAERKYARDRLGFSEKDIIISCVASLTFQKGHIFLLKALSDNVLKGKPIKLIIVGGGPLRETLRNKAESLNLKDKILFIENERDIRSIVGCCDIFVLPSIYEGFGIALLEAMCLKISCIATNVDGVKEILENSENGILVNPLSSKELANSISYLINNPLRAKELAEKAFIDVHSKFDIKKQIKRLEEIYLERI